MKYLTTTASALLMAMPMATARTMDRGGPDAGDPITTMEMDLDLDMSERMDSSEASHPAQLMRTRDISGAAVLTMDNSQGEGGDESWDADFVHDGIASDWTQIGTVEDIALDHGSEVVGIVAEIGGFLDTSWRSPTRATPPSRASPRMG